MTRVIAVILGLIVLVGLPQPLRAADEATFAGIVDRAIGRVIQPGYEKLESQAEVMAAGLGVFCEAPTPTQLDILRRRFGALVDAWSAVELFRFGPVREDNRHERLFFWPDRKGIGLRQVQAALAEEDPALLLPEELERRSVALQGLGALEFILFGSGSDALLELGGYRCSFAHAVAVAIAGNVRVVAEGWQDAATWPRLMRKPGADNPVYRSHAEVVRALLGAMTQQLEFVADSKIGASIGKTPAAARPRRAPLWRSERTLASMMANIGAVELLFDKAGFAEALTDDDVWIAEAFAFELRNARDAWARIELTWPAAVKASVEHKLLVYSRIPLHGAKTLLEENYAAATGLTLGFNALDGD